MSKSEENQSVEPVYGTPLPQPTTVDPNHEGEDGMGVRSMTVGRYEEIRRRLAEGRGLREDLGRSAKSIRICSVK